MTTSRPIIFTAAANYDRPALEPFVHSWKKHAGEAELVIFCSGLKPETLAWLEGSGVTVILAEFNLYPGGSGWRLARYHKLASLGLRALDGLVRFLSGGRDDRGPRLREAATNIMCQRFFLARRHLRAFGQRYHAVLLVDCRDAVFQRSPFPCSGLQVFAENETVGTSHFCKRWFQLTYGHAAWKKLSPQPLLCAGATLGDRASVEAYLDGLCTETLRLMACTSGGDQAILNYLVHTGRLPATVNAFGHGAAINLNATPLATLDVREGRMYARDGQPFAIVHQYDRVPGLKLTP